MHCSVATAVPSCSSQLQFIGTVITPSRAGVALIHTTLFQCIASLLCAGWDQCCVSCAHAALLCAGWDNAVFHVHTQRCCAGSAMVQDAGFDAWVFQLAQWSSAAPSEQADAATRAFPGQVQCHCGSSAICLQDRPGPRLREVHAVAPAWNALARAPQLGCNARVVQALAKVSWCCNCFLVITMHWGMHAWTSSHQGGIGCGGGCGGGLGSTVLWCV